MYFTDLIFDLLMMLKVHLEFDEPGLVFVNSPSLTLSAV